MKKGVRILIALFVLLIIVGVAAVLLIGTFVKTGVEKIGPRLTKGSVKLESARISVFGGSGELKGFVVGNPEGYQSPEAIKVGTIDIAIQPGSVFADKKVVRHIRVDAPEITYETNLKGSNLQKLLENVQGSGTQDKTATPDDPAAKTKLQVDELVITGGKVHVSVNAAALGSRSATVPLPEIRLAKLGQGPEGITPAELSRHVLSAILDATTKAVAANLGGVTEGVGEAARSLGTSASDQLQKAGSGVSDLLKKKKE